MRTAIQPLQKLIFTKGMNFDDSPEVLEDGEGRYRVNVRVMSSDNDENQAPETVLGNTLVTYSLPQGFNKVIGTKEDQKRGKVYYFIYNSLAHHRIVEYTIITNSVATVLEEDPAAPPFRLNFDIDHLITGIVIVELNVDNHLLYWTDYFNEPKKINIEKAMFFTGGDFINGYKSPFDVDVTYRIKKPPLFPPTYTWSNDSAQLINYLFKKLPIFKIQFVYDDKERSSWSPISKYQFPVTTGDGQSGEDIATQDNKVTVVVPTGSTIVTRIRIASKDVNESDFKLVAELDKAKLNIGSNTTYNFDFYNNGNYIILEVNESVKLFDNVPFLSKAEDGVENSRIVDANIVEGIDAVNIDMRLPISYISVPTNPNSFYPAGSHLKSGGFYDFTIIYYEGKGNRSGTANFVPGKSNVLAYDRYGTQLLIPFITDPLQNPTRTAPNQGLNFVPQVGVEIYNAPPPRCTHYQIARSKNNAMDRYIQFISQNVLYLASDKSTVVSTAAAAYVRIDILNIPGRYKDENPNSLLVYDYVKGDRIRFIANAKWANLTPIAGTLAPAGGNGLLYTFPTELTSFPATPTTAGNEVDPIFGFNDAEVVSYDSSTGFLMLKMNSTVPNNLLPAVLFEVYTPALNVIDQNEIIYEMGECRELVLDAHNNLVHDGTVQQLIEVMLSATNPGANTYVATLPGGHLLAINDKVKVVTAGYSIYGIVTAVTFTTATIDTTGYTLVGIFNGASPGTVTKAAIFTLTGGDSFKRYQDMPFLLPGFTNVWRLYMWVDAENVSNMFASKAWDVGRPNRIDPEYKRIARETTTYYSEKFIAETNINGLSTVYDLSFQQYDPRYGSIQRIYYENHRLIIFQELKVGEIPVQQIVYNDLQLNNTVGASSVVLSPDIVYYMGEYGIGKNPESFAVFAQAKYFIDVRRGVVLRLSTDGLTPISITAKMHNYFTDKCKIMLKALSVPKIYGVFDIKFKEYVIAFEAYNDPITKVPVPGETLAFNEMENSWSTFYSYAPDFMCGIDTNMISWKNGSLWVHNTNTVYNNFYGVQYKSSLWAIVNKFFSNIKVFKAIAEETNSPWEVQVETPSGQQTNMVAVNFQIKEGFQYAFMKRDINTPNVGIYPIVNGNPMRGQTALVKLEFPLPIYNKIMAANILFEQSDRSNK